MTTEKKTELINNVLQHRKLQLHGARVSNLAAAQDITHTVRRIKQSVSLDHCVVALLMNK